MTLIAQRYRLDRVVGRGGMGEVWLAEDTVLRRPVALKRIGALPGSTDADLDRVRREAQVSAMLNHEHVVAVFDLVDHEDQPWLVMEYLESENLAELVARVGPLPPDRTADLIGQAAEALAAAHAAGIVHRDVKPSNLLVTPEGRVKLSDFGIARREDDLALTQTGLLVGSPGFLAPEVASGTPATAASDMWSLGATAYHALAGESPYRTVDGNVIGTVYRIVNDPPPRTERAGWLGPALEHLMVHDPARRWSAERLAEFLRTPPVEHTQVLPRIAPPDRPMGPPAPASPASAPRGRRPEWLSIPVLVALGLLAALLALVAGIGLLGNDHPRQTVSRPPATTPSATPATAAGITRFVTDYLATAPTDPHRAFAMLTPAYREQSGGFSGYESFWGTIASAVPRKVRADPKELRVSYIVDYVLRGGGHRSEAVTLDLTFHDQTYLISGAR